MVAQSRLTIPSGPVFWQLFNSWRSDFEGLDTRVAGLEQDVDALEDRVDRLEPDRFTPAGSTASQDDNGGVQISQKPTEDLLRQSKIGVIVSKLRQQKDPKVVEQASKLVNKWKQDVNVNKKKTAGSPAPSSAAAKANAGVNGRSSGTSSPAPAAAAVKKEQSKKSTVDPAKRNSKEDKINTAVTGNQTRDACVKLMYDGLAFMSEESMSNFG